MNRPAHSLSSVIGLFGGLVTVLTVVGYCVSDDEKKAEPIPPQPTPRGYVCYQLAGPITIDGKLDDVAWEKIPWSDWFRDIEGDRRPEPALKTRVKMAWDIDGLYVAGDLEEPNVWATLKKHDEVIFHDNDFEMFIDPDADSHLYGELELNALNTTWDLLLSKPYKDGGRAIDAWEITGLKTAVHVDGTLNDPSDKDRGWTVEIFWPWKSLKELSRCVVPPKHGDQWRVNFSRVEWDAETKDGKYVKIPKRPEHNWVWSPQGAINMHLPERWGVLQFSTDPIGKTALRPDPAQPARDYLHLIYYAQSELYLKNKRYSKPLDRLGVALPDGKGLSNPNLEVWRSGFQASVELMVDGKKQLWQIDTDARIRSVSAPIADR